MRAWLKIIRLPNLFTVIGDPLAGFFLACMAAPVSDLWRAGIAAAAALCLYAGGLIGNDVADVLEDSEERPERPIPSGHIARNTAVMASTACAVGGVLLAGVAGKTALVMAGLTQVAIMLYNGWLKRYAIPGAIMMGACRGGSLLIGVSVIHPQAMLNSLVLGAAIGLSVFTAGVTWIAHRETVEERMGLRRWLPCVAWLGVILFFLHVKPTWTFAFPAVGAILLAAYYGWRLRGVPSRAVLGASIGGLIRGLLPMQAAWCACSGREGLIVAAVLLLFWPVSQIVGRRFYAT